MEETGLRERLVDDMKAAMKARESLRLETIRSIRGAIRNKEIETGSTIDEDQILRLIRTLVKQRIEASEQYLAGGRPELAEKETAEQAVLEAYLPAAPDETEMERVVRAVIVEVEARTPRDMGKVMGPALQRLGPATDGRQLSDVVRRLLAEPAGSIDE